MAWPNKPWHRSIKMMAWVNKNHDIVQQNPPKPQTGQHYPQRGLTNYNNNHHHHHHHHHYHHHHRIERCNLRFFTISSLCHEPCPTRTLKWPGHNHVQITCNTSSTYHVQHTLCHLVPRYSSVMKSDRVENAFILALYLLAKPLSTALFNVPHGII